MIEVILTFMYVGVMAIGGGLVTIPLLIQTVVKNGWITLDEFYNIVSISEATPGPIGLNIATYIGYERGGVLLSIIASFSLVIPSFILIYIISKFYDKYNANKYVKKIFIGLRAAVVGLIASALLGIFKSSFLNIDEGVKVAFLNLYEFIDYKAVIGFIIITLAYLKFKGSAVKYILLGGLLGIILYSI